MFIFGPEKLAIGHSRRDYKSPFQKLQEFNWFIVALITLIACVGFIALYSVAGGKFNPWASRQMAHFFIGLLLMLGVGLVNLRFWMVMAYPFYGLSTLLLVAVDIKGRVGMGAQRWLDLGVIQLQPSEIMKIALVLALARYFHGLAAERIKSLSSLVVPLLLILVPCALVIKQPDLGTALLLIMSGSAIIFLAGARIWIFVVGFIGAVASVPVAWHFLRDYQKKRVLIFLNPESDPLGAGYHILQSKIALGSGGIFGKGYLHGTQSQLNFLPEKQTDFIFTMFSEEFGLLGGLMLLTLYVMLISATIVLSYNVRSPFGRITSMGVALNFFLYVFINIAMVMGLLPVVGVPLPLVSYGGSAMLTLMMGFGLVLSAGVSRSIPISRGGAFG
jgi:rod shape determining protein RodA